MSSHAAAQHQSLLPGEAPGEAPIMAGVRALETGPTFWLSMFTASALGTNLGDFWVDELGLGRLASLASLVVVCGVAIGLDRWAGRRTEAAYWVAIVALRAAATNVADYLTHDLGLSYALTSVAVAMLALMAGWTTRPGRAGGGSPVIDGRYWGAMLLAGMFGTVAGDLASHTVGLFVAAAVLVAVLVVLVVLLGARSAVLPGSMLAYWVVVLAERCAGTPVGDGLASRHGFGLGLSVAMASTGGAFVLALLWRFATAGRQARVS